jgi:hypothetical protein
MRRVCFTMGWDAGCVGVLNLARHERRYTRGGGEGRPVGRRGVGGMGSCAKGVFDRKR